MHLLHVACSKAFSCYAQQTDGHVASNSLLGRLDDGELDGEGTHLLQNVALPLAAAVVLDNEDVDQDNNDNDGDDDT